MGCQPPFRSVVPGIYIRSTPQNPTKGATEKAINPNADGKREKSEIQKLEIVAAIKLLSFSKFPSRVISKFPASPGSTQKDNQTVFGAFLASVLAKHLRQRLLGQPEKQKWKCILGQEASSRYWMNPHNFDTSYVLKHTTFRLSSSWPGLSDLVLLLSFGLISDNWPFPNHQYGSGRACYAMPAKLPLRGFKMNHRG